jgi:hypothetical protein
MDGPASSYGYTGHSLLSRFASDGRAQGAVYFPSTGHVIFAHTTSIADQIGLNLVYNVKSDAFGLIDIGTANYNFALLTGEASSMRGAYGSALQFGLHDTTYAALSYINLSSNPCVICDDGGTDSTWSLTTERVGDESGVIYVNEVLPRYTEGDWHDWTLPAAGQYSCQVFYGNNPVGLTAGATSTQHRRRQLWCWHQREIRASAAIRVQGYRAGRREICDQQRPSQKRWP